MSYAEVDKQMQKVFDLGRDYIEVEIHSHKFTKIQVGVFSSE